MKNKINYTVIIAIVMLLIGCKDELNIPSPNNELTENFWTSENNAERGVIAIYATFVKSGINWWSPMVFDACSDEGYSESPFTALANTTKFIYPDYNFLAGSIRGQYDDLWGNLYTGIYRSNQVVKYVPDISMDETKKKQFIAEAKFLRGWFYFVLVSRFGNVPLLLEPNNLKVDVVSTEDATIAQILQDLREASVDLPEKYSGGDVGRVTKGAALALRSKVLMQQHKFSEALVDLSWLVSGPGKSYYGLMDNYADNFRHTTENNKESVFEICYSDIIPPGYVGSEDEPNHVIGSARADFWGPDPVPGCFGDGKIRRWVVSEFLKEKTINGERDPRLPITLLFDSTDYRGPDYTQVYGVPWSARYGYKYSTVRCRKYLNDYWSNVEPIFNSPINTRVIRYSDVLLLYAECLNETDKTTEAYQYVDLVRQRSKLPRLSDIKPGLSKEMFLQQLKHERILELCGESTRWWDLVRWGELDNQANLNKVIKRDPDFINYIIGKSKVFPIPQKERDLNPLLPQNPGW